MKKLLTAILLFAAATNVYAKNLDGTYVNGKWALNFKPNGKLTTVSMGNPVETNYVVEGDTVKFQIPGGANPLTLKFTKDGNLTGSFVGTFVKK